MMTTVSDPAFNFPDLATKSMLFCYFIKFAVKSILNDSQYFTSLNWHSLYPKLAFVRPKGYPIFRLSQNTGIYNLPLYP